MSAISPKIAQPKLYMKTFSFTANCYAIVFSFSIVITFFSCTKTSLIDAKPASEEEKESNASFSNSIAGKTNIILIVGDDIGFEIPTVDGGQSYSTPTLDMMGKRGVQFTQCHASPLCSPSRTSLITGKYNFRNYFTWGTLPTTERTIANMLQDAGYATCVSGKWQFDGGATSINAFGFEKYCVWDAYNDEDGESGDNVGSAYKDPKVYQNGDYLPPSQTNGKYGEDIFCQYVKDFIDSNKKKPFFIYYPMVLCHDPFCPTPDDGAAFAAWNPHRNQSDTAWFPSMVKYMDKKINEVLAKVEADGLTSKTLILYIGDNGTPQDIYSMYHNTKVKGGKSQTNEWGTHVPLFVYGSSKIKNGARINDLISLTDFLPTLAAAAGVPEPTNYGTLDGVSFYDRILGKPGTPRTWLYNYYNAHPDEQPQATFIWSQDTTYKLYNGIRTGFYNYQKDSYERSPIPDNRLTPTQRLTEANLQKDINSIH